jgi:hypothetical protein
MEIIIAILEIARRLARDLGPYLLIEVLLPGGSLLALGLFLYRRRAVDLAARPSTMGHGHLTRAQLSRR